jgi:iron(III) transport system substrate-binding protein
VSSPARTRVRARYSARLVVRGLVSITAIALVPLSVAACTGGSPSASSGKVTLTLYNGQHVQTTEALVAAFEKATGIDVAVRSDDEDVLDAEIVAEGSRSPADVVFSENSPALEYLQARGLLAPVDRSTLARTPAKFNSPRGNWVGISARVSVLIYNPSLIDKSALPTHVLEVADPRYRGKLAFAPGETDFQPVITSVLRTYGKAEALTWLDGIKTNAESHIYPDNEAISAAVNRGIVAFGVVNQYYWYRMRAEIGAANVHSRIAYFSPRDPGYVLDISGAAVMKSSRHEAAAQRLLGFLVSAKAQEIIAHSISFEYPIVSGVKSAQSETPFDELEPNPIDVAELGTGAQAVDLLRDVQLL